MPSSFRPEVGARISIDLQVGEHWKGEAVTRNPERIARFFAVHADGREELIPGVDGKSPAGILRPNRGELLWIGYVSRPTSIELAAEKFEAYLATEGLERVSEMRKQRGESQKGGKEIYSRSVKSLIRVGAAGAKAGDAEFDRKLGLPLEIIVERDPYAMHIGDELPVRVEFKDKPLGGVLVGCVLKSDAEHAVSFRTDRDGRARFKLEKSGSWLVRAVHMLPAASETGADWESIWASLTFELPEAESK